MDPHYTDEAATVYHGDCVDVLRNLDDRSVDAVVTDPPYGLEFMGKSWDSFREAAGVTRSARWSGERSGGANSSITDDDRAHPAARARVAYGGTRPTTSRCDGCSKRDAFRNPHACGPDITWTLEPVDPHSAPPSMLAFQAWATEWARECYRVLKPGGHLLAFGGPRIWHRLASAIEDSGFELRDSIAWLYGSGFPKSLDVGDAVGKVAGPNAGERWAGCGTALKPAFEPIVVARKPLAGTVAATVLAHGTGALHVDACRIEHASAADLAVSMAKNPGRDDLVTSDTYGAGRPQQTVNTAGRWPTNVALDGDQADELDRQSGASEYDDQAGASRFFPRFDLTDRDLGWQAVLDGITFRYEAKAPTVERPRDGETAHPTVKPLDLMRWLVRLVTPPGGLVLDPFAGSGTTAEACIVEGYRCITVERADEYLPLIVARLAKPIQPVLFG